MIYITKQRYIQKEGKVRHKNIIGNIYKVRLTETLIKTKKDDIIGIPHTMMIKKE